MSRFSSASVSATGATPAAASGREGRGPCSAGANVPVVVACFGVWSVVMMERLRSHMIIRPRAFGERLPQTPACPNPFEVLPTQCKRSGTLTPPCHLPRQAIDRLASPRAESETTAGRRSHLQHQRARKRASFRASKPKHQSPVLWPRTPAFYTASTSNEKQNEPTRGTLS